MITEKAAINTQIRAISTQWEYLLNDLAEACNEDEVDCECDACRRYNRAEALLTLFRDLKEPDQ